MTDPIQAGGTQAERDVQAESFQAQVYSKDYWDLVIEQLGRRKLFKLGMAVLALLYALAIYAPLIANDRPYVLESIDLGGYKSATTSLRVVASEVGKLLEQTDDEYSTALIERVSISTGDEDANEGVDLKRTRTDAIVEEFGAAWNRVEIIRRHLPPEDAVAVDGYVSLLKAAEQAFHGGDEETAKVKAGQAKTLAGGLRSFGKLLDAAITALEAEDTEAAHTKLDEAKVEADGFDMFVSLMEDARTDLAGGDRAAALAKIVEAQGLSSGFRTGLAAWDPAVDSEEDKATKKILVAKKSYPMWESISKTEMFFMVLWVFILLWPLWNRLLNSLLLAGEREKIRRWRRRKLAIVLGASGLLAFLWSTLPFYDTAGAFDAAPFKSDLASGALVLVKDGMTIDAPDNESSPVWPWVTFGFAEQHREEDLRPPTWKREASEINEEGHYVHGRRGAGTSGETAGVTAEVTPITVLPYEPARNAVGRRWLGTDSTGRDFFTRLLWGGRISLMVGILSAVLLTVIGVVMGSIAGYFGGWIDTLIMRAIEIIQSMPAFFLILAAMAFTNPDSVHPIFTIVIVIALIRWTGTARLVRGEFLRLREQEFVLAANALGFSDMRTIFRHVLPNAMSPVLVAAAFSVASGILTESAVSFLGMGTREPEASWGSLVNESRNVDYWWIQLFPGILIFLTVTCYNLVGDAIRDALDPKMKL
ncbi:MAG: ABC transporter permease [Planctomycetota bacterium]|nr:ABC transporter permease [Planctomycetota bacterium]